MRFLFQRVWLTGAGLLLSAGLACAQSPSSRPVSLMVPYPAGGPSDAIARIFSVPLSKALGQQVIVENLGGVSGAMAAQKVLAAPPDGHFVFQGSPNEVILSPLANAAVRLKAAMAVLSTVNGMAQEAIGLTEAEAIRDQRAKAQRDWEKWGWLAEEACPTALTRPHALESG